MIEAQTSDFFLFSETRAQHETFFIALSFLQNDRLPEICHSQTVGFEDFILYIDSKVKPAR